MSNIGINLSSYPEINNRCFKSFITAEPIDEEFVHDILNDYNGYSTVFVDSPFECKNMIFDYRTSVGDFLFDYHKNTVFGGDLLSKLRIELDKTFGFYWTNSIEIHNINRNYTVMLRNIEHDYNRISLSIRNKHDKKMYDYMKKYKIHGNVLAGKDIQRPVGARVHEYSHNNLYIIPYVSDMIRLKYIKEFRPNDYEILSRESKQFTDYNEIVEMFENIMLIGGVIPGLHIISRSPTEVYIDESYRFHNINGASIKWRDGYSQYYVHGTYFTEKEFNNLILNEPTKKELTAIENTTTRLLVINHHGFEKMIDILNAEKIDSWDSKSIVTNYDCVCELYKIDIDIPNFPHMHILSLQDHSTGKMTFITVPPEITTAKEAVSWSFNINKNEYLPNIET